MSTNDDQDGHRERGADDLIAAAARPGVDPCDVACAGMPSRLVNDLSPAEGAWLTEHVAGCRSCAGELDRFERAGGVLDRVYLGSTAGAALPASPVARRRRAGYARLESPIGPLLVAATEVGVCEIDFAENASEATFREGLTRRGFAPRPLPEGCESGAEWTTLVDAAAQLRQYFGHQRDRFDLPLDLEGVSPFTRSVLAAAAAVPYGRLETYRSIAERIGRPTATRAVGNALGRNPIPVVVPCHRIVRTGGGLGGYTGGLEIKQRLLAIEGVALV